MNVTTHNDHNPSLIQLKDRYYRTYDYYERCANADAKMRSEENRPFHCSYQTVALMRSLTAIQQEILWYFNGDKERASAFLFGDTSA